VIPHKLADHPSTFLSSYKKKLAILPQILYNQLVKLCNRLRNAGRAARCQTATAQDSNPSLPIHAPIDLSTAIIPRFT